MALTNGFLSTHHEMRREVDTKWLDNVFDDIHKVLAGPGYGVRLGLNELS